MKKIFSIVILMSYMGTLSPMFAESLVDLCEKHGRTKVVCENATTYQEDSNFVAQECDVVQDAQGTGKTLVAQDSRSNQPYDVNRTVRTTEDSSKVQDAQGTGKTLVAQDAHTFPKIASVLIDCTKGGVVSLDDAKIEIPPYALSENTQISIEKINQVKYTGELQNVTKDFAGYRFLPAGTQFQKEVVITLPYENEINNHKYLKDNLKTFFYDTKIEKWMELKRLAIDEDISVVKSVTTHFTDMINGTLSMPISAAWSTGTITTISETSR